MTNRLWPLPETPLPFNEIADDIKRRAYLEQVKTEIHPNGMVSFSHLPDIKTEEVYLFTQPRRRGTNSAGPL